MTACVQCFWCFPQISFASNRTLMNSFEKVSQPLCTELLWASLTFFQNLKYMEPDFKICHFPDTYRCVFGPGDAWACPRIYRFISKSENVGQTIPDPGQKLIVYTLPSIWQYPLFPKWYNISVFCQNRQNQQIIFLFVLHCLLYCLLAPVIPVWNNSACHSAIA